MSGRTLPTTTIKLLALVRCLDHGASVIVTQDTSNGPKSTATWGPQDRDRLQVRDTETRRSGQKLPKVPTQSPSLTPVRPRFETCLVAALLALSCGGAPRASTTAPTRQPSQDSEAPKQVLAAASATVAAPAKPELQVTYETHCQAASGKDDDALEDALDEQSYGFEFALVPLHPLPFGPRIAEMPRGGARRTMDDLREALERQTEHMNACYRWARYRQRLETVDLEVSFDVDQFGVVTNVVVSEAPAEFGACVQEGLEAMRVGFRTPRLTEARAQIRFMPSGLGRPSRAPERPRLPARPRRSSCIQQPVPVPVDYLSSQDSYPMMAFDDYNAEQEREEWERAHPNRGFPTDRCGCTTVSFRTPPEDVERTILSNLGVYRQCYRAALGAEPGLSGSLQVRSVIDDTGLFRVIHVQGAGGDGLHACVAAGFEELQVQPATTGQINVLYTFTLTPELPPTAQGTGTLARAERRLVELDAAGAAQDFELWLRSHPEPASQCRGRLGVLRAELIRAPWVDDPRVWQATRDFATRAVQWSRVGDTKRCLKDADSIVARVATWPYQLINAGGMRYPRLGRWHSGAFGGDSRDVAWERVQALLELGERVPGRALLLEFAAMVHADRDDPYDARQALVPVLAQRHPPNHIEVMLREFAAGVRRDALRSGSFRVSRPDECYPPLQ